MLYVSMGKMEQPAHRVLNTVSMYALKGINILTSQMAFWTDNNPGSLTNVRCLTYIVIVSAVGPP